MEKSFLKLVTDKPAKPKRVYAGVVLECRCGSRATIEVRLGRTLKEGKVSAGQKQIVCALCRTVLWG
jgi:hypothetical protein